MKKDREQVKQEIIIKARKVISKYGYKKSSTELIAQSLNWTKGALYHYFKNRDEILQAVIDYEGQLLKDKIIKSVESENSAADKLYTFFHIRAKEINRLFAFYGTVIDEYFKRYEYIMTALNQYNEYELNFVEHLIELGIEQKQFKVENINLSARAFISSMKGFEFFLFQGEKYSKLQKEMDEALRILIKGISKSSS
jgi:AcrR family transcriptional regulator